LQDEIKGFTEKDPSKITHVILLDQTLVHCPIFRTAASNNELGPYFNSHVAETSLKAAKNQRFGSLLKNQRPNFAIVFL